MVTGLSKYSPVRPSRRRTLPSLESGTPFQSFLCSLLSDRYCSIFKDNLIGVIDITKSSFDNGIKYPELLDDDHKEQVLNVVNDDNMSDEEVGEKVKEIAADVFETTPEEDVNLELSPDIESFLADLFGDADVVDNTDNSKNGKEPQEIEPEEKNDETDDTIPTDKESNEDGEDGKNGQSKNTTIGIKV